MPYRINCFSLKTRTLYLLVKRTRLLLRLLQEFAPFYSVMIFSFIVHMPHSTSGRYTQAHVSSSSGA
jgi:hypothetical protein